MAEHWNIQINIQRVSRTPATPATRGVNAALTGEKRDVMNVLELKVTAESERAAYDKAQRMLTANHPDVTVVTSDQVPLAPARRAIRDNPQA